MYEHIYKFPPTHVVLPLWRGIKGEDLGRHLGGFVFLGVIWVFGFFDLREDHHCTQRLCLALIIQISTFGNARHPVGAKSKAWYKAIRQTGSLQKNKHA